MRKKILFIGLGVAVFLILVAFQTQNIDKDPQASLTGYDRLNSDIKKALGEKGIQMSSPIRMSTKELIEQYCLPMIDEKNYELVTYCTSTELRDSEDEFLGNIHMMGAKKYPGLILGAVKIGIDEPLDKPKVVFGEIEKAVCNCWQQNPLGFESLDSLIEEVNSRHYKNKEQTRSPIIDLGSKKIQLFVTTNTDGYEWLIRIWS